ncbi:hypothetical protein [uncultured Marinobacter sp.]|uniref:hypothetical protein n=1 Tax=uncultured Marinobacter sp. TaxID=187379 RepID=UPI0030DB99CE|tara:strand:- start:2147 stop:2377 length:231 start_codon:yes stop_codon:yes gene_type:complete
MYAIEFEADIRDGIVKIPAQYSRLENSHARIILMIAEPETSVVEQAAAPLDLTDCGVKTFKGQDAVEIQREMRDDW